MSSQQNLKIIPEEDFSREIVKITAQLDEIRHSGFFHSFDKKDLYYEYYLAPDAVATVVVVHGLSEFTKKYYELTHYLLQQGYNVFLYDQRSHGLSCRFAQRVELIHVGNFEHYGKDLHCFINNVVLPVSQKPLYLYAHSMGCAASALYLARHRDTVQRAVFSAPFFEPYVNNISLSAARVGLFFIGLFKGWRKKFPFGKEFDPDVKFEDSADTSRARFEHNMAMRKGNPNYQSTPLTIGWTLNSLFLRQKMLRKRVTGKIRTPILMISAKNDTVVKTDAQYLFADKCESCQMVVIENADHPMLCSTPDIMTRHLTLAFDYLADGSVGCSS